MLARNHESFRCDPEMTVTLSRRARQWSVPVSTVIRVALVQAFAAELDPRYVERVMRELTEQRTEAQ